MQGKLLSILVISKQGGVFFATACMHFSSQNEQTNSPFSVVSMMTGQCFEYFFSFFFSSNKKDESFLF